MLNSFFDKTFTNNEFRKFMAFAGATVLLMTAYNLYLQIQLNHNELKRIAEECNENDN